MARVKTIGVLTSGGDAPGMNAAIRAVTRAGICNGFNIKGIYRGYDGLINGEIEDFTTENVSGIIMSGGTILKTARSKERGIRKSKKSCIVIVSESPKCGAMYYAERVRNEFPQYDVRVSILGHLQRGGRPSAHDRILASRTGVGAIEAIVQGQRNVMIGVRNNEIVYVPLSEAIRSDKPFDRKLIQVLDELSI